MDRIVEQLDASQEAAVSAALARSASGFAPGTLSIIGAPGTGKTTVLAHIARAALHEGNIAVLTQDRRAAAYLQHLLTLAAGVRPENLEVRTLSAFAYAIVQRYAQAMGREKPELVSGPDEDRIVREILSDGYSGIHFPDFVTEDVRDLPGLRQELRNLITRARELGLEAGQLESWAAHRSVPELQSQMWRLAAALMRRYDEVRTLGDALAGSAASPDRLDHSQLVGAATHMLSDWEEHLAAAGRTVAVPRPHWAMVLVDDAHNAPRSMLPLLRVMREHGTRIIVAGDPDSAVQGFRGGVHSLPGDLAYPAPRGLNADLIYLNIRHRGGPVLIGQAQRIEQALPVGGGVQAHRAAGPAYAEQGKGAGGTGGTGGTGSAGDARDAGGTSPGAGTESLLPSEQQPDTGTNPWNDALRGASFANMEEEIAYVASYLEEVHLRTGAPYARMAVFTRARSDHEGIRDALVRRGIPVAPLASDEPLHREPAVSALFDLIRAAFTRGPHSFAAAEEVDIPALLASPIIGMDPLDIKRVGRWLRAQALLSGEHGTESELLTEAVLGNTGPTATELEALRALLSHIREVGENCAMQAEEVLWAAWEGAGKSEEWQQLALGHGPDADRANRNLDAVISLFRVAQRMADRDPAVPVSMLVEEVSSQELPEDSIARSGVETDSVSLLTPAGAQGREWDHIVLMHVVDGVWPNPRLRDSLTGTGLLSELVTGRLAGGASDSNTSGSAGGIAIYHDSAAAVIADELRQLHFAVTRARCSLLVTTTDSMGDNPSRFFPLLGFDISANLTGGGTSAGAGTAGSYLPRTVRSLTDPRWGLTLPLGHRPLVAQPVPPALLSSEESVGVLRRALRAGGESSDFARAQLEDMRRAGFGAADPHSWMDELATSTEESVPGPVDVSPSAIESLLACPLDGFCSAVGLRSEEGTESASIGTLIHRIAEEFAAEPNQEAMHARLVALWPEKLSENPSHYDKLLFDQASDMVDNLYIYLDAHRDDTLIGVEHRITRDLSGTPPVRVSGSIDRLVNRGSGARVIDLKTGKYKPTAAQADDHPQLQVYQWALSEKHNPAGAELVYVHPHNFLKKQHSPSVLSQDPLDEETAARAEERVRSAAQIAISGFVPVSPSLEEPNDRVQSISPLTQEGRIFS
ncbi:ATP-dependent DNA helicase [Actinotignum sanguinis]|uniref:ATP-dependent DNA helicase n=1 Tax=Actinotignum sanguinis TaxID=1445614 RepID=UPI00237D6D17|nr:ATP-dependent DNA helicase [Actinotignum sanguinis]MDE1565635.1 ATP-dependent DNA helicase [Actinotignum sanguinis]MDE1642657.1 ATP-dependent DNA helicase [Actinotignum sanguinis]MDK8656780.1 ATP-dependent DNA helicase [Actinotignum sanguinis]